MSSAKQGNPILRAVLGIAALVAIVFLANWLMTLSPLGKKGLDLTEDKVHTLSEGTKSILQELDAPVVIRYYATRKSEAMSRDLKLYMRKVGDLLNQYADLSNGQLRIEYLDPQPDTDAEDSANIDGLQGQRIVDGSYEENIFHGVAISCLDQREVLPFLGPNDETRLEYELSRAIAQVSQPKKPVIGLMSAHNLTGGPPTMPGQPGTPPWAIYQQLSQAYEVRSLGMQPEKIDPEEITVLVLIHPANITPEAEYQIDQYVLKGGTVLACLDSYSFVADQMSRGNPMGGGGVPFFSTLPKLLPAWGVSYTSTQVVADRNYASNLRDGRVAPTLLTLTSESFPDDDDLVTQGLNDLWLIFSGAYSVKGGKGVSSSTFIQASPNAALVDGQTASQIEQSLLLDLVPDKKQHPLALRLSGKFKTAFPDGDPAKANEEDTSEEESSEEDSVASDDADDTEDPPAEPSLKEGTKEGSVILLGDSDFLFDQFAYQPAQFGNMRVFTPVNGNSVLFFNLIDQAAGSKYLIGSRSRASSRRPFTLVQQMEAQFEQRVGKKIEELEEARAEIQEKVDALQAQKTAGTEGILSPEQLQEERNWRAQIVAFNKDIREEQKSLKREKDELSSLMFKLNVLIIPLIVLIIAIIVQVRRRSLREAR
jgi:ABC-type uncharacterized transport system involved in gliding motility auxiliary subunit